MDETLKLPTMDGCASHEELDERCKQHASYYTVVQMNRGKWRETGSNYIRHEVHVSGPKGLEAALEKAKEVHAQDPEGRGCMIYAVADFSGCMGFSRHLCNYPPAHLPFKDKGGKFKKTGPAKPQLRVVDKNFHG